MRIYQTLATDIKLTPGEKTFNDFNESGEDIHVSIVDSKVVYINGQYEASLTPEQIEEIKRSLKNDHLHFA